MIIFFQNYTFKRSTLFTRRRKVIKSVNQGVLREYLYTVDFGKSMSIERILLYGGFW